MWNILNCPCSEDHCDLSFLLVAEEKICFYYSFLGLPSLKTAAFILIRFFFLVKFALLGRKQIFLQKSVVVEGSLYLCPFSFELWLFLIALGATVLHSYSYNLLFTYLCVTADDCCSQNPCQERHSPTTVGGGLSADNRVLTRSHLSARQRGNPGLLSSLPCSTRV